MSDEAQQLDALRALIAEIIPANRFYTPILERAGVDATIDRLDRIPFTTKQQLIDDQQAHPPYGTNLTYPIGQYTRFNQTSATTGTPMRWLDTPESWQWMLDNWRRVYEAAGVTGGDRVFFAFSFGPFLGFWTAFEAATQMQCLCIPGGGMSSTARLRTIIDNRATVLCCTPTYAMHLGQVAHKAGINLGDAAVKVIIVAGEPGGSVPATRQTIEAAWPTARVFDHHGMTEVGPVSYECPEQPGRLLIIDSSYIAEVIDPQTGGTAEAVDTGELVLTTLGRTAAPLLRYRTGDLVQRNADGSLEGGILSRADDMVLVRGVNLYPSAVDQVIRSIDGVAEYRVDVDTTDSMAEISVTIEPCEEANNLDRKTQKALRDAFNLRIPVTLARPNELPRFEMKAKRWIHR